MNSREAREFLGPAVDGTWRVCADLGAGSGTFTVALAGLLNAGATVYAVDNDPEAVRQLRRLKQEASGVKILALQGDVGDLDGIAELQDARMDAVLLSNVLHYFANPEDVLNDVAARLLPGGRI